MKMQAFNKTLPHIANKDSTLMKLFATSELEADFLGKPNHIEVTVSFREKGIS